jgi:opacity protein-like surface antigen
MRATRLIFLAALALGLGLAGRSALAADAVTVAPAPAVVVLPWHGLYAGGGGGYAWGEVEGHAHLDIPPCCAMGGLPSEDFDPNIRVDGGFATAIVGADVQRGPYVFGAFVDYAWLDNFDGVRSEPGPVIGFKRFTTDIDNLLTVAGRVGLVWQPQSLLYGLAGWSRAQGSLSEFEGCLPVPCDNLAYDGSVDLNGWTVGAGLERLYHDNRWSVRLEYRFTHLDGGSISGSCTPATTPSCGREYFGSASADADIQSLRATATVRLGALGVFPRLFP